MDESVRAGVPTGNRNARGRGEQGMGTPAPGLERVIGCAPRGLCAMPRQRVYSTKEKPIPAMAAVGPW